MNIQDKFWNNKRVLITGHTGFKGSWLSLWLASMGAKVTGVALRPNTTPSLFNLINLTNIIKSNFVDIRNASLLEKLVVESNPEIVFHLAAQPLVLNSYRDPLTTFSTNVMGTANLLNSFVRLSNLKVVVMITTDKVYRSKNNFEPYIESDILGGHDPYSASKAASELVINSFYNSFLKKIKINLSIARSGNVIGGGDWSKERLLPDAIKSWQLGNPVRIRNPEAIRPWQHVLEPLQGYLNLAKKMWDTPNINGAFNFGPDSKDSIAVRSIIKYARDLYGSGEIFYEDISEEKFHEEMHLTLDSSRAKKDIEFQPKYTAIEAIDKTINWYKLFYSGKDALSLCESDIESYLN